MGFWSAVRTCLGKYVVFRGRASRSEYWFFILFFVLASMAIGIVDSAVFPAFTTVEDGGPLGGVFGLAMLLPLVAAGWRRMHDSGRSGFYVLVPTLVTLAAVLVAAFGLGLADFASGGLDKMLTSATLILLVPLMIIAVLSPLLVLWWLTRPSQPDTNSYGPNPHEVAQ